jgi:TetR/AcrR family transcriptional regulator, fatty acid metabolism regulator protein
MNKSTAEKTQSDKYQKIIQAATHVFASQGFYNSKVSDIAREADVADGTIYLYFKNKDDILISIFENSMDAFIGAVEETLKGMTNPVEKLHSFIRLHLELVQNNQDVAQVLQIELRQSSKFMKEYAATKFRDYLEIISGVLEEGQRLGVFKKEISPAIVKRAIFGAVDEMALEWVLMKKKKYTLREVADQLCLMLTEGLKG